MFAAAETDRLEGCLGRLAPYFDGADVALTGGVAVEYHLAMGGRPGIRETLADLDFVARRIDGLAPGMAREFLVSHYHVAGPGVPKALVQLVDPIARLRIDIFPDLEDAIAHAGRVVIGSRSLLIVSAESILEHKRRTLSKASAAQPVDPKHWRDATALAEITGRVLPQLTLHSEPQVLCTDVDVSCARCELSRTPDFP